TQVLRRFGEHSTENVAQLEELGAMSVVLGLLGGRLAVSSEVVGEACGGLRQWQESLDLVLRALQLDDKNVRCLCAAGEAYQNCDRLHEAFQCFFKATEIAPDDALAWSGMGYVLLRNNKGTEALTCLQKALSIAPANPDIMNRLGLAFLKLKNERNAVACFLNSLKQKPDFHQAWCNLAVAWRSSNEIQMAIKACERALKIQPRDPANWTNLGVLYQEQNNIEEALFAYRKAISIDDGFHLAHVNEGIALLLKGDMLDGWAKYEYRWRTPEIQNQRQMKIPLWRGTEPLSGKTILLHADQGFGDTIQCLRFVPLLAKMGAIVHLEVNSVLVDIARQVQGLTSAVSLGEAGQSFDFQCPFLSLPRAFISSLESIPRDVPYLQPSLKAFHEWKSFEACPGKLRVALVWRGNPKHENDKNRSFSLEAFKPLLALEKCEFINLQWGLNADEEILFSKVPHFRNVMPAISTFDDTAAVMGHVDLVITVDSAVAHLAGALGKRVWVLLPFAPDWRWLLNRIDSPWYPTARLFRQPRPGDWGSVVQEVVVNITALLDHPKS
ncbi:MAG: tetratricopeptide repeat-containing glycosyltransferase family protein, partial [Verrucomicrobiota bacterium]